MNSEIVRDRERALLAAWNRRDYDAIVENLSPRVVLVDLTVHQTPNTG